MQTAPRDQPWTAQDGARPDGALQSRPAPPFIDLFGRQPVRITAEGRHLVAYGFGRQRIAIPAGSILEVATRGPAVIVVDHDRRILLKAPGTWEPIGLAAVCYLLGVPLSRYRVTRRRGRARAYQARAYQAGGQPAPDWPRAPGYRRLRVRPRGFALGMIALMLLALALLGAGIAAGVAVAVALPVSIGSVRNLIGVVCGAAGAVLALWLFTMGTRAGLAAARWAAASLALRSPAPWTPFYPRGGTPGWRRKLLTTAMVLAVPAVIGWGPGVGIATLVHGFSDQALVAHLRADGERAPGLVIAVPHYSTDSDGDPEVDYVPTLYFSAGGMPFMPADPAIGGCTWPAGQGLVTVVYDPSDPDTAAVAGQLRGSVWAGAPLGNLIAALVLTLALPVLIWRLVVRLQRNRRAARDDLLEGIW